MSICFVVQKLFKKKPAFDPLPHLNARRVNYHKNFFDTQKKIIKIGILTAFEHSMSIGSFTPANKPVLSLVCKIHISDRWEHVTLVFVIF